MDSNKIISEFSVIKTSELLEITLNKDAIFFDMDGTILNSETLHFEIIDLLTHGKSGYTIDELYGLADSDVYPLLKDSYPHSLEKFLDEKNELLLKKIPETPLDKIFKAEIFELIQELKKTKKLALVTASEDVITDALLTHCKVKDFFDIIITRQDVQETKPAPDPYNLALKMLKTSKEKALVFEDSPTGIISAQKAGIDTIKVSWYDMRN